MTLVCLLLGVLVRLHLVTWLRLGIGVGLLLAVAGLLLFAGCRMEQ